MSILKILHYPNNKLRKKTKKVKKFNEKLKLIIKNMFNTMYYNKGIGLASTQVNINKSIIVINLTPIINKKLILINPILIKHKNYIKTKESCLSIPNYTISIKRYKEIIVKSHNQKGKIFYLKANKLLSICIQHEIDHLNGKLIIDY